MQAKTGVGNIQVSWTDRRGCSDAVGTKIKDLGVRKICRRTAKAFFLQQVTKVAAGGVTTPEFLRYTNLKDQDCPDRGNNRHLEEPFIVSTSGRLLTVSSRSTSGSSIPRTKYIGWL